MSNPSATSPPATAAGIVRRPAAAGEATTALGEASTGRVSGLWEALSGTTAASSWPRTRVPPAPDGAGWGFGCLRRGGRRMEAVVLVVVVAGEVAVVGGE